MGQARIGVPASSRLLDFEQSGFAFVCDTGLLSWLTDWAHLLALES